MRGNIIDNDSEPGSWADALRFPPFISDERDGTSYRNIPAMRFEQPLDPAEGGGDAVPAFTPVSPSLHDQPDSQPARDNPHAR